jgi:uncharacterized membrane protein YkoI
MKKTFSCSLFGALLACSVSLAMVGTARAYTGEQLASQAKVNIAQARHIALSAQPGTIVDQELEQEGGGSGLRYSFDIKSGGATHEVGVDAQTGKVLEDSLEGPNSD